MFRRLSRCVREYKRPTQLTLVFILLEAVLECLIPFVTADLVNRIQAGTDMTEVLRIGLVLIVMALLSLVCGGAAGFTCARASAGFAKNLRQDAFRRVQSFAFENVDKFSSSSLVTRMTTDVSYVQMAFMTIIRTAVRAPLVMLFSIVMAYLMGGSLATSFVVIIPVLGFGLYLIARKAMPAFRRVFRKYAKIFPGASTPGYTHPD